MTLTTNPQLDLAFDYVQYTNQNIFLTGKAGTGKTTFLHRIKNESIKRMAVVAPTGVAAINAKGMTIHSLFQLPFGPFLPNNSQDLSRQRKFSRKKINLIKSLDLLIIDEISMVRADTLDAIDSVLRRYKNYDQPFGGTQILMIGDLHQLPPVVRPDTWNLLREHYETPYFFSSLALHKTNPVTIELKHIYRQSDRIFIDLLNKVRNNQMDRAVLDLLNSRYQPDFTPSEKEAYITLTSHNNSAQTINNEKLNALNKPIRRFTAKIEKDFPEHAYPTDEILELKEGAQVLFIKNDLSAEKLYYNGKIGQITEINGEAIYVKCPDDPAPIFVSPVVWDNVKYTLEEKTKEVKEEIVGTFSQYPLKLAWAITIHKSQGLTFERAIIDAASAFAHGQVYVALSRCKSFEGIILRSKINHSSIKTDATVQSYSEEAERNAPNERHLQLSKQAYQQSLILELFDFQQLQRGFSHLKRIYYEHENTLTSAALAQVNALLVKAETEVFDVAQKFRPQIENYFLQTNLPEDNQSLLARLQKAGNYFFDKLQNSMLPDLKQIPVLADGQLIKKKANNQLESLEKQLFIRKACFKVAQTSFSVQDYMKAKVNADLDYSAAKSKTPMSKAFDKVSKNTPHPDLYFELVRWRRDLSADFDVRAYEILSTKSILELVQYLPTDAESLRRIKGIGPAKVKKFGADIIQMIETYCQKKRIPSNLLAAAPIKAPKVNTKKISLDLFKEGKTIKEISLERNLMENTIQGHLAHFISTGEIDVLDLVDRPAVEELSEYLTTHKVNGLADVRAHFNEKYTYGDIKTVIIHLEKNQT